MSGEIITFSGNSETWRGYLARSAEGKGPGVVVIQEWWGLVDHIKEVVDRFASEGYTALAPDLYKGVSTDEPDEAGKLMMALNISETEKALRGAVDSLLSDEAVTGEKVGVVGFCMGGQLSLYTACANPKIGACVDYYGIHPNVQPALSSLSCPLLGFFAMNDSYATSEAVDELDRKLDELNKEHSFISYPDTDHAFFNNDRPEVYNEPAAEDSWKRMTGFLRVNLR